MLIKPLDRMKPVPLQETLLGIPILQLELEIQSMLKLLLIQAMIFMFNLDSGHWLPMVHQLRITAQTPTKLLDSTRLALPQETAPGTLIQVPELATQLMLKLHHTLDTTSTEY